MKYALLLIPLFLLAAGCTYTGASPSGSANYQRCVSQCGAGNAGNGSYCIDGCRLQEASQSNSTYWCDQLSNQANRPSCYGTVAKSSGDRTVCDRLNSSDRQLCISIFGQPGTS